MSGLVLYYDMNNIKSWQGRPITNQFAIPTPDSSNNVTFSVQGNGVFQRVLTGNYAGYDIKASDIVYKHVLVGSSGCWYHGNDVTINSGQVATWSFDYYVDPSATGYAYNSYLVCFEGVVSAAITDTSPTQIGVWKRLSFSATASSTGLCRMLLYPGACGSYMGTGGFVLFKNPQVEFDAPGSNPSPFVQVTRSTTQALLDLTGNNTLTATSLTYNSDGTFSFNGSSDGIKSSSTIFNKVNGEPISVCCWAKPLRNAGQYQHLVTNRSDSTYNWILYQHTTDGSIQFHGSAQNKSSYIPTTGVWIYIVATVDPSGNSLLYINGVVQQTVTGYTYGGGAPGELWVGRFGNSNYEQFQGSIPIVQVYNKTLTAAEIKQNFSASRGRYGV